MHQYIETVRTEVEKASGQESYLASSLFLRMHKNFKYEDEGAVKLTDKSEFEEVANKAMVSISGSQPFDLKSEILSWQAAILRDVAKDCYAWWIDYKDQNFLIDDCFEDGESCIALEATSEKLGIDPTKTYTNLLQIEHILTRLATSCYMTILEIDKFWQFSYQNKNKAPENEFMLKRIQSESKHTILCNSVTILKEVSQMCYDNAKKLAGADHILWMKPFNMLESLIEVLNGFVNFEYTKDSDLNLSKWLNVLFPARLASNEPNLLSQSPLHHKIIARLSQATQCLVMYTTKGEDSFAQRDSIMRPFIHDILMSTMQISLKNMNEVSQNNLRNSIHSQRQ